MRAYCPGCGNAGELDESLRSSVKVRCKACNTEFQLSRGKLHEPVNGPAPGPPAPTTYFHVGPVKAPVTPRLEKYLLRTMYTLVLVFLVVFGSLVTLHIVNPAAASRLTFAIRESTGAILIDGERQEFSRTFVFWAPDGPRAGELWPDNRVRLLHDWIMRRFGGYSRWRVEGQAAAAGETVNPETGPSTGWFYQVSLPLNSHVHRSEIEDRIRECFAGATVYLIETPHYR